MHNLLVTFAWQEDPMEPRPWEGFTVIKAAVNVSQAGIGWSKLHPVANELSKGEIGWQNHFIRFSKRFDVEVTLPIGDGILKELGLVKYMPIRLNGTLDTMTLTSRIELINI